MGEDRSARRIILLAIPITTVTKYWQRNSKIFRVVHLPQAFDLHVVPVNLVVTSHSG